jgi:sugar O-acyltransferase (sialic acid O-acetyltransferase NeuD family)
VIIGAGNYSNVLLNYLIAQNEEVNVLGFLDDNPKLHGTLILGKPVLGYIDLLKSLQRSHKVDGIYCPIGNNKLRLKFLKKAKELNYKLPNFIHISSVIGPNVHLGKGIYIMPGTIVMPNTNISDYCMLSMGITIGHDTFLEEGVFIANGCSIGGNILIKEKTFIGMGATIISGIKFVGKQSIIGAGAVVIKNVPDFATVVGNPGRVIKLAR